MSTKSTLITGDKEKREKLFNYFEKWSTKVCLLSFIAGIVWFFVLPYKGHVHKTYISENALLPGLVTSDIDSTTVVDAYYESLKKVYDKNSKFETDWILQQFKDIGIEAYIQNFNITNPLIVSNDIKHGPSIIGRNVYAISRAYRTANTESIVVSAPLYYNDVLKQHEELLPNFVGIAQLLTFAKLARTRSYWAKDLIFIVTDIGHYGLEAWLNSYYDISNKYLQSDNLIARGGAIQAAINLQINDPTSDKLLLKLEGANGQLPNLDLFNTIIRICDNNRFKCGFENLHTYYASEYEEYMKSFENMMNMMLKQATGVPSSQHGFFLKHHIEALTIQGVFSNPNQKYAKQNTLKMIRIVEGTLRSVNNLLERFHQSFFFYLLPNEHSYVSIGMYMPVLGCLVLPVLVQIIYLWLQLLKLKFENRSKPRKFDTIRFLLPDIIISAGFGVLHYIVTHYFVSSGMNLNLEPKEALIVSHLTITVNALIAPYFVYRKIRLDTKPANNLNASEVKDDRIYERQIREFSWKISRFISLILLVVFIGALSIINFSLAFFISLVYVPVCVAIRNPDGSSLLAIVQRLLLVFLCPIFYFSIIYFGYYYYNSYSIVEAYDILTFKFLDLYLLAKLSNIWTYDLICLILFPLWLLFWFQCTPRIKVTSD